MLYFGDINNADQYKQLISTLDSNKEEKNKFKPFKNKIMKAFNSEFIDLFSSPFFNRDFNRVGTNKWEIIVEVKVLQQRSILWG